MKDIIIKEINTGNSNVKVAMLIYVGSEDPVRMLDAAVSQYVGHTPYNEYIDSHLDNPWVRVLVKGVNEIKYEDFDSSKHRL